MLYSALRFALFRLDPELSHSIALPLLNRLLGNSLALSLNRQIQSRSHAHRANTPIECMGLRFPNCVGLAAGLDKNGDYIDGLGALGFGFIEIGTVTPKPQSGNPKPRLFRLAAEQAIINRMGFNNKGVDYLIEQVNRRKFTGILGINIGKNADTPLEDANDDYLHCLRKVYALADYVTVNISSPNTPGLRDLQHGDRLHALFTELKKEQAILAEKHQRYTPIAIKIAPDMQDNQIQEFADAALAADIDGVIATNTTFSREGVERSAYCGETGGLSGAPLTDLANNTISQLSMRLAGKIPVIGVGGIMDVKSGTDKLTSGASLIQIYTGLIYHGPSLISKLKRAIKHL